MKNTKPVVWTIAGSDSGGGAGIQADLKTFHAFDVHGCSVITAITAQNSYVVTHIEYTRADAVRAQLAALSDDLPATALKLGIQGDIAVLQHFLQTYTGKVIFDPVITASSGAVLNKNIENLKALMPYADMVTPNLVEAEKLTGLAVKTHQDKLAVCKVLRQMGAKAVLLKGGHDCSGNFKADYYDDGKQQFCLSSPAIAEAHTHGSGCTLAAAITASLALGYSLPDAVVIANMYVHQGIRLACALGKGEGAVVQAAFPVQQQDLPLLSDNAIQQLPPAFPALRAPLGLYPVVDSSEWILRLAKLGVKTLQLRLKTGDLAGEVQKSVAIAKQYNLQLFINDHWQLAIEYGAYGLHLGQQDLQTADLSLIRQAGLRLGISTHCFYEVARAYAINPSYMACGPVYATDSKPIPFVPQGLQQLAYWRRLLNYPLVAIGGINLARTALVKQTGVDGIAMISAITRADDVRQRVAALQRIIMGYDNAL